MKKQFEEYVKELTMAICDKILLTRLEELVKDISINNKGIEEKTDEINKLYNSIYDDVNTVNEVCSNIPSSSDLNEFRSSFKEFCEVEENIHNDINIVLEDILHSMKDNAKQIGKDSVQIGNFYTGITVANESISEIYRDIPTKADLRQFREAFDEFKEIEKRISEYIGEKYISEIDSAINAIILNNNIAQMEIDNSVSAGIQKSIDRIKGYTDKANQIVINSANDFATQTSASNTHFQRLMLETEKKIIDAFNELIKRLDIGAVSASDTILKNADEFAKFTREQKRNIEKMVENTDKRNTEFAESLKHGMDLFVDKIKNELEGFTKETKFELEQFKNESREEMRQYKMSVENEMKKILNEKNNIERREENLSWKLYMMFSNTIISLSFIMLVLTQRPWEVLGTARTVIGFGIIVGLFLIMILLRHAISKLMVDKSEKRKQRKFE